MRAHFDLLIRGGMLVDGTRLPRRRADVGISAGRVARIGQLDDATADRVLDADGLIVAPGFVDLHTHYDAQVFWDPYCSISSWHGITSVVIGNCGFGFAPVRPDDREKAMRSMTRVEAIPYASMQAGMPWTLDDFPRVSRCSCRRRPRASTSFRTCPSGRCWSGCWATRTRRPGGCRPRPSTTRWPGCCTRRWMRERAAGPPSGCCRPAGPRCSVTGTARRWSPTSCTTRPAGCSLMCCASAARASSR